MCMYFVSMEARGDSRIDAKPHKRAREWRLDEVGPLRISGNSGKVRMVEVELVVMKGKEIRTNDSRNNNCNKLRRLLWFC